VEELFINPLLTKQHIRQVGVSIKTITKRVVKEKKQSKVNKIKMEQQTDADNNVKPILKEVLHPGNKYIELISGTRVSIEATVVQALKTRPRTKLDLDLDLGRPLR